MEILYWSPTEESEETIYENMKKTYNEIHTYKDSELYGKSYQPASEVLTLDQSNTVPKPEQIENKTSDESEKPSAE